jgi:hypothetical protein
VSHQTMHLEIGILGSRACNLVLGTHREAKTGGEGVSFLVSSMVGQTAKAQNWKERTRRMDI